MRVQLPVTHLINFLWLDLLAIGREHGTMIDVVLGVRIHVLLQWALTLAIFMLILLASREESQNRLLEIVSDVVAGDRARAADGVAPFRQLRLLLGNLIQDILLRSTLFQFFLTALTLLIARNGSLIQQSLHFFFFDFLDREKLKRLTIILILIARRQGAIDPVKLPFNGQLMNLELRPGLKLSHPDLLAHVADHSLTALIAIALKVNALARYRVHILKIMKRALIMILWQCLALHALGLERLLDHIHDPIDTMVVITGCILILRCILQFVATKCQSL